MLMTRPLRSAIKALRYARMAPRRHASRADSMNGGSTYSAEIALAGVAMARYLPGILMGIAGLTAAHAIADQLEEQDPVRVAQRLKDCVAQNLAKRDGRTRTAIRQACAKAIADGSYHDPNISLDGMIKSSPQQ